MKNAIITLISIILLLLTSMLFAQREPTKEGTRVGDIFFEYDEFDAKSLDGKKITTKDFKGKYVFVDFWATWCPPCKGEFPFLARVEEKLAGEKFMMLGISLDTDLTLIPPFKKEYGVEYPNISDGKGWRSIWVDKYGISSIPTNFLLDPEGKIIVRDLRGYGVEFEAATALGVETAIVHIVEAQKLLGSDDEDKFDKAKARVDKALKLEPDYPDVHVAMGDVFLAQDETKKARERYDKALKNVDKSVDKFMIYRIHEMIGESYAKEGDWKAMIGQYAELADTLDEEIEKLSVRVALIKALDRHERKAEGLEHRKILLEMFDKQPKQFRGRQAGFRASLADEIEAMEEELKPKED